MAIQLEQVYYLTKDSKEFAVLVKDQSVTDALSQHDLHNCRRVCRCRLVSPRFARGESSHAIGCNDVSASAFKIEVFVSLVSINTKDVERCVDGEFVDQLSDLHSGVREGAERALTAFAHAIEVHPEPAISETQASVCVQNTFK